MTTMIEIPTADNAQPPRLPVRATLTQKQIQQLSASHYGWCPYADIELMGPNGLERKVAYDEKGDLVTRLNRSDLLLFENIETKELSVKDNNIPNGPPPLLEDVVKYAASCIQELHDATYGEWGFTILTPLTGLTAEAAWRIFQVIQPKRYDLATLDNEIRVEAKKRIAQAVAEDKDFSESVAEETRILMLNGANRAIRHARKVVNDLRTDMATFIGTKQGKSYADPADEHAFTQLHQPIPSPIAAREQSNDELQTLIKLLAAKALQGDQPNAQESQLASALAAIESMRESQEALTAEVERLRAAEQARQLADVA
jgi:hypothetical protein